MLGEMSGQRLGGGLAGRSHRCQVRSLVDAGVFAETGWLLSSHAGDTRCWTYSTTCLVFSPRQSRYRATGQSSCSIVCSPITLPTPQGHRRKPQRHSSAADVISPCTYHRWPRAAETGKCALAQLQSADVGCVQYSHEPATPPSRSVRHHTSRSDGDCQVGLVKHDGSCNKAGPLRRSSGSLYAPILGRAATKTRRCEMPTATLSSSSARSTDRLTRPWLRLLRSRQIVQ